MAKDLPNQKLNSGSDNGYNNSFYYNECIPCPDGHCTNVNAAFTWGEGSIGDTDHCEDDQYFNSVLNECRTCDEVLEGCAYCSSETCTDCGETGVNVGCATCAFAHTDDSSLPVKCTENCATSYFPNYATNTDGICTHDGSVTADIVFN